MEQDLYNEIRKPDHYVSCSILVQPKHVFRRMAFPQASALKYILRAGKKPRAGMTLDEARIVDLNKAIENLNEIPYDAYINDVEILKLLCELTDNDIIRRAYYKGIRFDGDATADNDGPKNFWANLRTIAEYEITSWEILNGR